MGKLIVNLAPTKHAFAILGFVVSLVMVLILGFFLFVHLFLSDKPDPVAVALLLGLLLVFISPFYKYWKTKDFDESFWFLPVA